MSGPQRRSMAKGVAYCVVGVATFVLALTILGGIPIVPKLALLAVSLGFLFQACRHLGSAVWGSGFDAGFWLCMGWLGALGLAALFADLLPLGEHKDTSATIAEIGNKSPDLLSSNPLGTNNFALDLLARSIYGARVTLLTVAFAVTISIVIGGGIGLVAGYIRGAVDTSVSVVTDTVLAIPPLVLLVALAAVLGAPTGIQDSALKNGAALAIVGTPAMIRLSRSNSMVFSQREFVLASRAMGATNRRILFRELLPNVILPIISYSFIIVAVLIVAEGSLAFLGLGLAQPQPTWGNMIAEADLTTLREHPHVFLVPAAFLFLTVFAFNRIGERARQVWDPRDAKV